MAQATAFGMALREARTAVVAKHELLHGKKVDVGGAISISSASTEDLEAELNGILASAKARKPDA
jgi:hypothetical protein